MSDEFPFNHALGKATPHFVGANNSAETTPRYLIGQDPDEQKKDIVPGGREPDFGDNKRRMVRATLLGQHTHKTLNGINVHIWQRGRSVLARGRYDGNAFGELLGANDDEAAGRLRQIMVEIESGTFVRSSERRKRPLAQSTVPRLSVRQLCDNFLANKRKTVGQDSTTSYMNRLAPIIEFAEDPGRRKRWPLATDVNADFAVGLKAFLAERIVTRNGRPAGPEKRMSPRQIFNVLDCTRTVFNWGKRPEINQLPSWHVNPFTKEIVGSRPKKDPLRPAVFSLDCRQELVKSLDFWQLMHLAIALVLPLRPEDYAGLLIRDMDLRSYCFRFGTRFSGSDFNKGGQEFTVPFPTEIAPLLMACVGDRVAGPLLRKRTVFDCRRQPIIIVASPSDVTDQVEQALAQAPAGTLFSRQDHKKLVRRTIRAMGGVSEDSLAKEFKQVLDKAGMAGKGRFYDLRGSTNSDLEAAGVSHQVQLYVTGHSLGILGEYVSLNLRPEMNKYFTYIQPLLSAMAARARDLGLGSQGSGSKES